MPRIRKQPIFPLAISPSKLADALDIARPTIVEAIKSGAIPCYQLGNKRRVLWRDVVRWIRRDWKNVYA